MCIRDRRSTAYIWLLRRAWALSPVRRGPRAPGPGVRPLEHAGPDRPPRSAGHRHRLRLGRRAHRRARGRRPARADAGPLRTGPTARRLESAPHAGGLGERFNPAVLKTAGPQGPVSSNLTASATAPGFMRVSAQFQPRTHPSIHPKIRATRSAFWCSPPARRMSHRPSNDAGMSASHFSPWGTSPKPCWHCNAFESMAPSGGSALCTRPNAARVQSMPAHGCSAFEREPGADDEPDWIPGPANSARPATPRRRSVRHPVAV